MSLSVIAAGGADRVCHGSLWIWTYILYLVANTKSLCCLQDYTKLYCRKLELTCKVLVLLGYFKIFVPIRAAQRCVGAIYVSSVSSEPVDILKNVVTCIFLKTYFRLVARGAIVPEYFYVNLSSKAKTDAYAGSHWWINVR